MIVKELVSMLKEFPDDAQVMVWTGQTSYRDPCPEVERLYRQYRPNDSWYWERAHPFEDHEKVVTL